MNWDAIGAIGEVAGALGVIFSLVYLSLSIRRSTAASRSTSHLDLLRGWQTATQVLMQDATLRRVTREGLHDYDALSNDEKYLFFCWMIQSTFQARIADTLHREGTLSQEERDLWVDFAASNYRTRGGERLWEEIGHVFGSEAAEIVEARLRETAGQPTWDQRVDFMRPG